MRKIAILGAGLAGLTLARQLGDGVVVFEKSRGPSGRLATRRHDAFEFDHGAQFFTARDPEFAQFLEPHLASGLVQEWKPRLLSLDPNQKPFKRDWFEPHYVAVPGMTALAKALSVGLDVRYDVTISNLRQGGKGWLLNDLQGETHGPFDWVISTCPAPQTANLLPADFLDRPALEAVRMQPCFGLMVGFSEQPETRWEAANVSHSPLGWLAWNHRKPGRNPRPALVALSDNGWAEEHLEDPLEQIEAQLKAALCELEIDPARAETIRLHRWRFASTVAPAGRPYLFDAALQLAACGDWCIANRVEAAFTSASALGRRLQNT